MANLSIGLKTKNPAANTFFSFWHFLNFLNTFQMVNTSSESTKFETTSYKMSWVIEERGPVHG
jgi:hypothetical protein